MVKAIAVLFACATAAGCFWRSYGARMGMHTDLLVAMTRKGADLVEAHGFSPETLPELHYPLDRARAFAATARRHAAEHPPASLRAFEALLDAYGAFCRTIDEVRRDERGGESRSALRGAVQAVEERAALVRQALSAEGHG